MFVVELGFPELTTEQIELLCQTAEGAARKHIFWQRLQRWNIKVQFALWLALEIRALPQTFTFKIEVDQRQGLGLLAV